MGQKAKLLLRPFADTEMGSQDHAPAQWNSDSELGCRKASILTGACHHRAAVTNNYSEQKGDFQRGKRNLCHTSAGNKNLCSLLKGFFWGEDSLTTF